MIKRWIKRILLWGIISLAALIALIYVGFYVMSQITSDQWAKDLPHFESINTRVSEPHRVKLLKLGLDSLTQRLQLIEQAKKSIDLEFFIYSLDDSARMITQALAEQSRKGIKVRVMVDFSLAVFQLSEGFAKKMREAGIEVKYYNTSSAIKFFTVQHRTHRKILVVDNQQAIIGGRNIANDYFDLSDHYNFLDSDMLMTGPLVKAMSQSFEVYWNSEWAISPNYADMEAAPEESLKFLEPTADEIDSREKLTRRAMLATWSTCNDAQFVSDYPGSGEKNRRLFREILKVLSEAKKEILVETPYFIIRPEGADAIHEVLKRDIRFTVLTNSLHSTDAYYTVAAMVPTLSSLKKENMTIWAYSGDPLKDYDPINPPNPTRWGVHSKRAVIDDDTVLIGTYNIDPRSANLNSELMVICRKSPELAAEFRQDIEARIAQSKIVLKDKEPLEIRHLLGSASTSNIVMMVLSMPVARWFDFLL